MILRKAIEEGPINQNAIEEGYQLVEILEKSKKAMAVTPGYIFKTAYKAPGAPPGVHQGSLQE